MNESVLCCRNLTTGYDGTPVLVNVDLAVGADETLAVLGPSGSGKTTLFHAVAGFLSAWDGEIWLGEQLVGSSRHHVPPERRHVGVVFQHYALWPHRTVLGNVSYPIERRGTSAARARQEAEGLLERMGIAELASRRPVQLSGGQQQRVGLARALARRAQLYLFDEPTAHLDAALRTALQEELASQRRQTGASAVYTTHDATEALAVADRAALLRDGRVVQTGTPMEVYARPVDLWAAELTGPASVLTVEVAEMDADGVRLRWGGGEVTVAVDDAQAAPHGSARALVRPDWTTLGGPLSGVVAERWYRGPHTDYRLDTPAGDVVVRRTGPPRADVGERPGWGLQRVWLLPPDAG